MSVLLCAAACTGRVQYQSVKTKVVAQERLLRHLTERYKSRSDRSCCCWGLLWVFFSNAYGKDQQFYLSLHMINRLRGSASLTDCWLALFRADQGLAAPDSLRHPSCPSPPAGPRIYLYLASEEHSRPLRRSRLFTPWDSLDEATTQPGRARLHIATLGSHR